MGRSQETFRKKENEKKKQHKKKEKEQRKEDRKSSQNKGQSLESMMAYVDENGNLSTTPPDPRKTRTVRAEDIEIGVPQRRDEPEEIYRKGTVAFFDDSKGYGFIQDLQSGDKVFVHVSGLVVPIKERDRVTFRVEQGDKGPKAVEVKKE